MELELRALVVIYYAALFYLTSNWVWVWSLLAVSFAFWLWSVILEDGYPAGEAPIENQRFYAARAQRQQQAHAAISGDHFARHSGNDSHQEAQTPHGLPEAVGTFRHAPERADEWDGPEEAGGATLDRSVIWEQVVGDGVGAESSQREHHEVAQVEAQVVAVQNANCCGGHAGFSDLEKDEVPHHEPEPLHAPLNTTQSIPRIPEPRDGVQLRPQLGGSQLADVVRAADPQSGLQQLPMDHNAGPSAQLLGGSTESEDGSSDERSESDGSPLESPVGRRWSRPFVLHWN